MELWQQWFAMALEIAQCSRKCAKRATLAFQRQPVLLRGVSGCFGCVDLSRLDSATGRTPRPATGAVVMYAGEVVEAAPCRRPLRRPRPPLHPRPAGGDPGAAGIAVQAPEGSGGRRRLAAVPGQPPLSRGCSPQAAPSPLRCPEVFGRLRRGAAAARAARAARSRRVAGGRARRALLPGVRRRLRSPRISPSELSEPAEPSKPSPPDSGLRRASPRRDAGLPARCAHRPRRSGRAHEGVPPAAGLRTAGAGRALAPSTASRSPSAAARGSPWWCSLGAARSTLGRCLIRLLEPTAGAVRFDGVDLQALGRRQLRRLRRRFEMVFQDPYGSLDPRLYRRGERRPAARRARRPRRAPAAGGGRRAVRARRPVAGARRALPAPALRRPAPAGGDRPRPRHPPDLVIADSRSRPSTSRSGADPQPPRRPPRTARPRPPLHLPRPGGRRAPGPPGGGALPRAAGRGGAGGGSLRRAAAPLYGEPAVGGAGGGGAAARRRTAADRARRRAAGPGAAPGGLSLRPALPGRRGALRGRGAAAHPGPRAARRSGSRRRRRARSSRRLFLPRRAPCARGGGAITFSRPARTKNEGRWPPRGSPGAGLHPTLFYV